MKFKLFESTLKGLNAKEMFDQLKLNLRKKIGEKFPGIQIDSFEKNNSATGLESISLTLFNEEPYFDAELIFSKQRGSDVFDIVVNGKMSKKIDRRQLTKKSIPADELPKNVYEYLEKMAMIIVAGLSRGSTAAQVDVKAVATDLAKRIKFDLADSFANVQVVVEPIEAGYEIIVTNDEPFLDIAVTVVHNKTDDKVHVGIQGKAAEGENYKTMNHQAISSLKLIADLVGFARKTFFIGFAAYRKIQKNRDKKSRQSNIKMY